MGYGLICDSSAEELGIVDDRGHFDMSKFHKHVEDCDQCLTLMENFVKFVEYQKRSETREGKKVKKISSKRNRP